MAADGCRREKARPINHTFKGITIGGFTSIDTLILWHVNSNSSITYALPDTHQVIIFFIKTWLFW